MHQDAALRIEARCLRTSLSHRTMRGFVDTMRRLGCSEAFSPQHDGALAKHRAMLFRHVFD
jgi:hypothetical protein